MDWFALCSHEPLSSSQVPARGRASYVCHGVICSLPERLLGPRLLAPSFVSKEWSRTPLFISSLAHSTRILELLSVCMGATDHGPTHVSA